MHAYIAKRGASKRTPPFSPLTKEELSAFQENSETPSHVWGEVLHSFSVIFLSSAKLANDNQPTDACSIELKDRDSMKCEKRESNPHAQMGERF